MYQALADTVCGSLHARDHPAFKPAHPLIIVLSHVLPAYGLPVFTQHLCSRPLRTPYAGGGALVWPPPAVLPSTNYAAGLLGQGGSAPGGGDVDRNDLVLEEVASR